MSCRKRDSADRLALGDPVNARWREICEGRIDACRFQPEPIQQAARNGATKPISELVHRPVKTKLPECSSQDRSNLSRRHRQKRQSTDNSASFRRSEDIYIQQCCRVHFEKLRLRDLLAKPADELNAAFNHHDIFLGDATCLQCACEDPGSRTKLENMSGRCGYLLCDCQSKAAALGNDRRYTQRARKPGKETIETVAALAMSGSRPVLCNSSTTINLFYCPTDHKPCFSGCH